MSIESVDNSNVSIYTTGAGLAGAAIGGTLGYNSRPFLKDGNITDSFVRNLVDNASSIEDDVTQARIEQANKTLKQVYSANSVDELKAIFADSVDKSIDVFKEQIPNFNNISEEEQVNVIKQGLKEQATMASRLGMEIPDSYLTELEKASSMDEIKAVCKKNEYQIFDKKYGGKSLEEIRQAFKQESFDANKKAFTEVFEGIWNKDKNNFIESDNPIVKYMKKVAQKMQMKTAAIYGVTAAAALSAVTYLLTAQNHSKKE